MDIHQKRALAVALFCSSVFLVVVVTTFHIGIIGILAILLIGLLFAYLFLKINRWMNLFLNNKEYPNNDWYRAHLERNYDAIILGDEISRKRISDEILAGKRVFDLSRPDQNLNVDFLVLKNTFSILKPKGEVYLPIRDASILYMDSLFFDERRYYWALSPYVFDNSAFSCIKKKIYTRIPALMFRFKDLKFIISSLKFKDKSSERMKNRIFDERQRYEKLADDEKFIAKDKLDKVVENIRIFCKERDLILKTIKI